MSVRLCSGPSLRRFRRRFRSRFGLFSYSCLFHFQIQTWFIFIFMLVSCSGSDVAFYANLNIRLSMKM